MFKHCFIPARRVVENISAILSSVFHVLRKPVITTTECIIYKIVMCISYLHNHSGRGSANSKLTGNVWRGTINKMFMHWWPTINNLCFRPLKAITRKTRFKAADKQRRFRRIFHIQKRPCAMGIQIMLNCTFGCWHYKINKELTLF